MSKKKTNVYDLELHEGIVIDQTLHVTRVPGGWIYETPSNEEGFYTPVFVPYSNEFY